MDNSSGGTSRYELTMAPPGGGDILGMVPPVVDRPFRIPDTMPVTDRLLVLEHLSREGTREPLVRWIAADLVARAPRPTSYARFRATLAEAALRFVQATPYRFDPSEEDWFQPASWTAVRGGDCEDKSSLLVSLYHLLDVPGHIVWITQVGQAINHVTVAAWVGDKWCWTEPAVVGAGLCESPYEAIARTRQSHVVTGVAG